MAQTFTTTTKLVRAFCDDLDKCDEMPKTLSSQIVPPPTLETVIGILLVKLSQYGLPYQFDQRVEKIIADVKDVMRGGGL